MPNGHGVSKGSAASKPLLCLSWNARTSQRSRMAHHRATDRHGCRDLGTWWLQRRACPATCQATEPGCPRRILQVALDTTDVGPIEPSIHCQGLLRQADCHPQTPNITGNAGTRIHALRDRVEVYLTTDLLIRDYLAPCSGCAPSNDGALFELS